VGGKVNGRLVPLQYALQTGDIVEVVTQKNHHPSKDWLSFVKTVKAKSKIRQWVKTQEKERSLSLGREMCEKAFRKHKMNFNTQAKSEEMAAAVVYFGFKALDDLVASVGYGKITPLQIIRRIEPKADDTKGSESILNRLMGRVRKKKSKTGVVVKGVDDILIKFGKCCQPVPGDDITGYITRGFGVTVHRVNCVNALKMSPQRRIDVEWHTEATETFPADLQVSSYDRVGLLSDIVGCITKNEANILSANTKTGDDRHVESSFSIGVRSTEHLKQILSSIRKVRNVQAVRRVG
jgi:GTP pyrophosphokinase